MNAPAPGPPRRPDTEPSALRLVLAALVFVLGLIGGGAAGAALLHYVPPFGQLFDMHVAFVMGFMLLMSALGCLPGLIMFRRALPKDD